MQLTNREVLGEISLIESLERTSPDRVRDFQQQRLERLLHHAWRHRDYYHDVLESCGAVRGGNVNLDRFEDIPFLTKDIIRTQFERLRARQMPDGRRAYMNNSGGTTGAPIRFQRFIMLFRTTWDDGILRQFQFVQELDGSLTINLVPEAGFSATSIGFDYAEITRKIRLVMGEDCVVRYEVVSEIPLSASGKFPYIVRRH